MDNSSAIWMSELEMDDDQCFNLIQQYQMNIDADDHLYEESSSFHDFASTLVTEINGSTAIHDSFQSSVAAESVNIELKPAYSGATPNSSSRNSSNIISFANPKEEQHPNDWLEFSDPGAVPRGGSSSSSRSPLLAQDHVLNERKRRERMAKQFVALSAIIPNKKKMDKGSILGEAMKYIKELQERGKELEREENYRKEVESFVSVKRARGGYSSGDVVDDVSSSSEENSPTGHLINNFTPEIEVRVSGANLLVKIHCHKRSGLLLKALEEIQKHRVSIVSSNAMPFANNSTLLIDIIAQMEEDNLSSMTANELVEKLELAILNFM